MKKSDPKEHRLPLTKEQAQLLLVAQQRMVLAQEQFLSLATIVTAGSALAGRPLQVARVENDALIVLEV
jgi:hypothetical protein